MQENENKDRAAGYDAYTQPADAKHSRTVSYSFTYDAPAPELLPEEEKEKSVNPAFKLVLVTSLVLLLVAVIAFVILFFVRFKVEIQSNDGVFNLQIAPREAAEPESTAPAPLETQPPADEPAESQSPVPWDGTKLVITSPEPAGPEGMPEQAALNYQAIYKKCAPSVVAVTVVDYTDVRSGTGVIMSKDGYIITCSHLVEDQQQIYITLESGEECAAALVGQDSQTDLAVLKIDKKGLPAAEFGDSEALEVGETVLAIGNPMGQNLTLTDGIISAIDRSVEHNGYTMTLLQTNAAINEGNSGGPLLNTGGQVIGITNMKMMSYYSTVEGIGFAIPISSAKTVVDALLEHGYVAGRPAIGIKTSNIPSAAAAYYGLPAGALVDYVFPETDACQKGLTRGDIITAVDGKTVGSTSELDLIAFGYQAGDQVKLTIFRNGESLDLSVTLCDLALLGD